MQKKLGKSWQKNLAVEWEKYEEKICDRDTRYENDTALRKRGQNSVHI